MITADKQQGFTIIEVMIAITVFAIGIIGINILQTASIRGYSAANLISGRTNWAADQIEQIVSWNYTDPRLIDDGNPSTADGNASSPDNAYSISWFVTDNATIANTKTITIRITNTSNLSTQPTVFTWVKPQGPP